MLRVCLQFAFINIHTITQINFAQQIKLPFYFCGDKYHNYNKYIYVFHPSNDTCVCLECNVIDIKTTLKQHSYFGTNTNSSSVHSTCTITVKYYKFNVY